MLVCFIVPREEGKTHPVLLSLAAGGRSSPVVRSGQQMPEWSGPWQCPGTGQLPSSQTSCAPGPGVIPQLSQRFSCKAKRAAAHPESWTPEGTAEVEQKP